MGWPTVDTETEIKQILQIIKGSAQRFKNYFCLPEGAVEWQVEKVTRTYNQLTTNRTNLLLFFIKFTKSHSKLVNDYFGGVIILVLFLS